MSKAIKLTDQVISEIKEEFCNMLATGKFADGKVNYSYNMNNIDRKANLIFSEMAWLKTSAIVQEFSTEVAWHGTARRGEDDDYYVDDIIMYPQVVTGTTVDLDKERSFEWMTSLSDEVYANMKMHGHSHVNMGVTPSSTDLKFYKEEILDELNDDSFYIFMIMNKKHDITVKIYDYRKNIFFDTADVNVSVLDDGIGVESFVSMAKSNVRTKTYEPPKAVIPAVKPPVTTPSVTTPVKETSTPKYKRKETTKKYGLYSNRYTNIADDDDDDDFDDYLDYSYYGYYPRKGY